MDLGLGSLIDKVEDYFGKRVARVVLFLVVVAIGAGALAIIWTTLIAPLLVLLDSPERSRVFVNIIWIAAAAGIATGVANIIGAVVIQGRQIRTGRKELEKLRTESSVILDDARSLLGDGHQTFEKAEALHELARSNHEASLQNRVQSETNLAESAMILEQITRARRAAATPSIWERMRGRKR